LSRSITFLNVFIVHFKIFYIYELQCAACYMNFGKNALVKSSKCRRDQMVAVIFFSMKSACTASLHRL